MGAETIIRLSSFIFVLAGMMAWELLAPRRALTVGRSRWAGNLGVVAIDTALVRVLAPGLPAAAAFLAGERGWGLMNVVQVPFWVKMIAGIVLLDLAIYLQHAMFHALPALWRLHMMHHADRDIDATTGLRFHPLEIVISLGIKTAAVVLIGAFPGSVIAFEVLLNATSLFNHGNVRMPAALDAALRLLVVTPDMHRVHHSVIVRETGSNFGFNLSVWDRLFGTYRAQPEAGHRGMTIGLSHLRDARWQNLFWMVVLPFTTRGGAYPLGRYGRGLKE